MSNCTDCPNASRYHEEVKDICSLMEDAIKLFSSGKFVQAIEDFQLAIVRLNKLHRKNLGR